MAKTKNAKRDSAEVKDALEGLKTELKRLGKAVSKQLRSGSSKGPKKKGGVSAAAKRTEAQAKTAAKKTTKAAKKHGASKAKAKAK